MTFAADNDSSRLAMVRAAERLFAERGVDGVSLSDVDAQCGVPGGTVAACFGSKAELLDRIVERHASAIASAWMVTLDHGQSTGNPTLRELIEILVRGIFAKVDDPDGGREFISIAAQLVIHRHYPLAERRGALKSGSLRLIGDISALIKRPAPLLRYRLLRVTATIYQSIVYHLNAYEGAPGPDRELFVADLIDSVEGQINAHASAATQRLLGTP